jgi:hypothetical protein
LTEHTCTCFLLVQGCRSGWRLCGKNRVWRQTFSHEYVLFWRFFNKYLLRKKKTWALLSGQHLYDCNRNYWLSHHHILFSLTPDHIQTFIKTSGAH